MACAHGNAIVRGAAPAPCGCSAPAPSVEEMLAALRAAGWMVAVHNDYRQNGKLMTFWLLTRHMLAVKGEGETDIEALTQIAKQVEGWR